MDKSFSFDLDSASTSEQRMAGLEKFILFWLGPRHESFGVSAPALDRVSLPLPLRRLYAFAGNWRIKHPHLTEKVAVFSIQEHLRDLGQLEVSDDNKLIFLDENQGNWTCATLPTGIDPPVWVEDVFQNYG